jgi:MarR family transcriptional regulator, transcriptional regulator for hemolysin
VATRRKQRSQGSLNDGIPNFSREFGSDRRAASELALTWSIFVAARKWKAKVDHALSTHRQTQARLETLSSIAHRPKGITQADLAKFMRIEGPTLVRILDRLEADGLVTRAVDAGDGRRKSVTLSAAGRAALAPQRRTVAALRKDALAHLSDREIDAGIALLRKILPSL